MAQGGSVVAQMAAVTLPSKFTLESHYAVIDVGRWTFPDVSLQDNRPYWLAGFINTAAIENFKQVQIDDTLHTVNFGSASNDPGRPVDMVVTDVYDIKNFTLALSDATTLNLLKFSDGKYPMYHLEFKFYAK